MEIELDLKREWKIRRVWEPQKRYWKKLVFNIVDWYDMSFHLYVLGLISQELEMLVC